MTILRPNHSIAASPAMPPKFQSVALLRRFADWKRLKKFAALLDKPVRGTPVEDIVREERDR